MLVLCSDWLQGTSPPPHKLQITICKLVNLSRDIQEFIKRESHLQLTDSCRVNNNSIWRMLVTSYVKYLLIQTQKRNLKDLMGDVVQDNVVQDNVDQGTFTMPDLDDDRDFPSDVQLGWERHRRHDR